MFYKEKKSTPIYNIYSNSKVFFQNNLNMIKEIFHNVSITYFVAFFFSSSNMERGERHPIANHGEILHEKLAP